MKQSKLQLKLQKYLKFNPKLLLISSLSLIIVFFVVKSTLSSSPNPPPQTINTQSCTKLPPSLSDTILHYATSNTTPQQTLPEVSVTARVLTRKSPCNFLVFGLGHDSLMWAALNHGGRTVFIEEDQSWIDTVISKFPSLEAHHATYNTKVTEADELLVYGKSPECTVVGDVKYSTCRLALKELPEVFYEVEWDLIMVDAPTGWIPEAPGRMGAIYTAGMAARARKEGETHVFVHDCDRVVEDKFSKEFLCEGYLSQQEGRLRHFTIPSHRTALGMPFCPM